MILSLLLSLLVLLLFSSVSDRVIPSHVYPSHGLACVTASTGLFLIHSDRLAVVPSDMPDDVAASFSVPFRLPLHWFVDPMP